VATAATRRLPGPGHICHGNTLIFLLFIVGTAGATQLPWRRRFPQHSSRRILMADRLISADKVEGTTVYNPKGDKLGSINNVMIDKVSGKVAYADMSFGGFLGIGDRHHPLPWGMLTYDTGKGGYVVNLDKKTLEGAPTYGNQESVNWEDETWGRKVHDYYGVPPFWM
jgi:hypothetical protein